MKLYSYAMPRKCGLTPNPYFGYCTLAIGKPIIRKCAEVGDWIAVYGALDTAAQGKMVALMCVNEILTFDEYWEDERFMSKRPAFDRDSVATYGDNIYHRNGSVWVQEKSLYSIEDENLNRMNTKRDTQTNRVLIASEFYYFDTNVIALPVEFTHLIPKDTGDSVYSDETVIQALVEYVRERCEVGMFLGLNNVRVNEG